MLGTKGVCSLPLHDLLDFLYLCSVRRSLPRRLANSVLEFATGDCSGVVQKPLTVSVNQKRERSGEEGGARLGLAIERENQTHERFGTH